MVMDKGDTRPHIAILKELHCKWAAGKKAWYYRTDNNSKPWFRNRRAWDLNTIRRAYGSRIVMAEEQEKIA